MSQKKKKYGILKNVTGKTLKEFGKKSNWFHRALKYLNRKLLFKKKTVLLYFLSNKCSFIVWKKGLLSKTKLWPLTFKHFESNFLRLMLNQLHKDSEILKNCVFQNVYN